MLHLKWIIINLKYKWCFIFYIWRPSCVDAIIPLLYGTKSIINDPRSFLVQLKSNGILIMHQKCNYLDCLLWTNTLWFYGLCVVQITWQMIIDTFSVIYFGSKSKAKMIIFKKITFKANYIRIAGNDRITYLRIFYQKISYSRYIQKYTELVSIDMNLEWCWLPKNYWNI